MSGWVVVAISGVTNGGKTTLAKKLKESFSDSVALHQDQYFYPDDSPNHVKCPDIDHNDYDRLSALDMEKMFKDIMNILSTDVKPGSKRILILDGFILLNYSPIYDICHLKYRIHLNKEASLKRRLQRVYDPPDVPGYFERCVWPSYLQHAAELEDKTDIILLDGNVDNFARVYDDICKYCTN